MHTATAEFVWKFFKKSMVKLDETFKSQIIIKFLILRQNIGSVFEICLRLCFLRKYKYLKWYRSLIKLLYRKGAWIEIIPTVLWISNVLISYKLCRKKICSRCRLMHKQLLKAWCLLWYLPKLLKCKWIIPNHQNYRLWWVWVKVFICSSILIYQTISIWPLYDLANSKYWKSEILIAKGMFVNTQND